MVNIKVEYEGWIGNELGLYEEEVSLDCKKNTIGNLINYLKNRDAKYKSLFDNYHRASYIAVNDKECFDERFALSQNDTVIFHMQKVGG